VRLVLDADPQILTVRAYAPGEIDVAGQKLRSPFILSAARLITDWAVRSVTELDLTALEPLLALRPDVVVIGADGADLPVTGPWRRAVEARNVAIEVMNLGAACRTYNVLANERRAVVAGLFP
jgi:uncharacterized protein